MLGGVAVYDVYIFTSFILLLLNNLYEMDR